MKGHWFYGDIFEFIDHSDFIIFIIEIKVVAHIAYYDTVVANWIQVDTFNIQISLSRS